LNVRAAPSDRTDVRGWLPSGQRVSVVDGPIASADGQDWYLVENEDDADVQGWVHVENVVD
jgi:hypothetical protein